MLGKVKSVIPLGQKEKKKHSYLKDRITKNWVELRHDLWGQKRTHSVKISMVPEVLTVGYRTQLSERRDSQAFAFPNHWQ